MAPRGIVVIGASAGGVAALMTIVQEPSDAEHTGMPESVLQHVQVDHITPVCEMGALLRDLVAAPGAGEAPALAPGDRERLELQVAITQRDNAFEMGMIEAGDLSPFTIGAASGNGGSRARPSR